MTGFLILVFDLVVLYFLGRIFIQKLFNVLYRLTHDRDDAAQILGWVFLPGTFIHEISHFLFALILLVPVGELDIMPEATEEGVRLGKVETGKTDFIRGSLIGLAPILTGGSILLFSLMYGLPRLGNPWIILGLIYIIFEITHSMFSSKEDLYAVLELIVFLVLISGVLIYFKIYSPFMLIFQELLKTGTFVQKLSYLLFIPILLELIFLAFFRKVRT